jgi:tetratricopeptide (TPR) repeat protein
MQSDSSPQTGFTQRLLPWGVAAGALLLYLFTMAHGITPGNAATLSRVAGWSWQPVHAAPLHFLVTYPIRWLPAGTQPWALSFFGAVCAALTLALLARSVALLPHDRTRDQRQFEPSEYSLLSIPLAWVPPVLAALVCGLQLTFWESATVANGEIFDLLLFAYVIRCLLEYRIDTRESWLVRMAFVYGLGMTNNFALIGFLPVMLAAVLWIRGLSFFNFKFLTRMALAGLAGLSLYLLLPAWETLAGHAPNSFWEMLRFNLGYQKHMLASFPRYLILLLGLTSLLPALFMGIKWPASFGDISAVGTMLTNFMMHVMHALFLAACAYVAFDPEFSPRQLTGRFGYPLLSFYYLGALSMGYFSGYFLLVFGPGRVKSWQRGAGLRLLLNRALVAVVLLGAVAMPVALAARNLPEVRQSTRPHLSRFGEVAAQVLKESARPGALVLSDDFLRLYAVRAALERQGRARDFLLLETASLPIPLYHWVLHKRHPDRWPQYPEQRSMKIPVDSATLIELLAYFSGSSDLFYLHPSFGYYFEHFYLSPKKVVYQMKLCPTNSVAGPTMTSQEAEETDAFWDKFRAEELASLVRDRPRVDLKKEPVRAMTLSSALYSRSLNHLGVEFQRAGQLDRATKYFEAALELNPDNPSAFINRDYNRLLRSGSRQKLEPSPEAVKRLAPYGGSFDTILGLNGPVEEPDLSFRLAQSFAMGRNFRQAAQTLERVVHFTPDDLEARVWLMNMYNQIRFHDKALAAVAAIRALSNTNLADLGVQMELLQAEAVARAGQNDFAGAERLLLAAQRQHPKRSEPFAALAELYVGRRQLTNAMAVLDQQLQLQPNDLGALVNAARLKMLNSDFAAAMPLLDRALQADHRNPAALMNRAIACLQTDRLDEARRDYMTLRAILPRPVYAVSYGLHEIAWRKKQRKEATKYAQEFLKLAPPNSAEAPVLQERLRQLKRGTF